MKIYCRSRGEGGGRGRVRNVAATALRRSPPLSTSRTRNCIQMRDRRFNAFRLQYARGGLGFVPGAAVGLNSLR